MKRAIPDIIILILLILVLYQNIKQKDLITSEGVKIEKLKEESKELVKDIQNKQFYIDSLTNKIDSLSNLSHRIDSIIIEKISDIDISIAKDSANSIKEYRKSIFLFNYKADLTDYLTYREIGIGSKIITEAYGWKLKLNNNEQIIANYKEIGLNKDIQLNNLKKINENKNIELKYWQKEYEKTQNFFYDRFVISIGVGGGYTGEDFQPFIGLTFGIKIWGSK